MRLIRCDIATEPGVDLASEHERYLSETVIGGPVIVYNYPKAFKAFYMRVNEPEMDGGVARETVAALDILVPKVGELVGGSQREERMDVLEQRILEMGLELGPYEWYLDLRRHGELLGADNTTLLINARARTHTHDQCISHRSTEPPINQFSRQSSLK